MNKMIFGLLIHSRYNATKKAALNVFPADCFIPQKQAKGVILYTPYRVLLLLVQYPPKIVLVYNEDVREGRL